MDDPLSSPRHEIEETVDDNSDERSHSSCETTFWSDDEEDDDSMVDYPSEYPTDSANTLADIERITPNLRKLSIFPYDPSPTSDEWIALGRSIGGSSAMKKLRVCADGLGEDDEDASRENLEAFCTGLSNNRSLKTLIFREFDFTRARLETLRPLFIYNRNLVTLKLFYGNLQLGDIRMLSNVFRQRRHPTSIKSIGLQDSTIGNTRHYGSIHAIIDLYNACPRLKILELCCSNIGDLGCSELASILLGTAETKLECLYLRGNSFGDEGALALANSIANNGTVKRLGLDSCREITARGWNGFLGILCDTSSINASYQSNHTLERMWHYDFNEDDMGLSKDLKFCLHANEGTDKSIAARKKILHFHLKNNFDLSPFLSMDEVVLPNLLGWIGKDYDADDEGLEGLNQKCSAFYRILRNFPDLCGYPSWERKLLRHLEVENSNFKQRIEKLILENEELKSNKRQKHGD